MWPFKPTQISYYPSPEAQKLYRQAVSAYHDKQYSLSAERFDAIREQTTDKRFALMALYGAACSRLMEANTPQQYHQALTLWDKWVKLAPQTCDYEDSALLDPLIKNKMIFSKIPLTPVKTSEIEAMPNVPKWLLIKSKQERDRLRYELDMTQQTLEKRQKKIQALEKDIDQLKGQIKALETIDQKIEEKKKAIPTTDAPKNGDIK